MGKTTTDEFGQFFHPKRIALVGASADYRKLGNSILMNLLSSKTEVYPISLNKENILGTRTYKSLKELPEDVDLVVVAVAAKQCPGLMSEIRQAGAKSAVIISGGFSETDEEGEALETLLVKRAKESGVRFLGPNCVGISNTRLFNATFTMMPEQGNIAFVSQSGALGGICIYKTQSKHIGMSKFVSIGNAADITLPEIIDYFHDDEESTVIAVYTEGIEDGRSLFESLRNVSKVKPIVLLKGGRSEAGKQATKSHTGSLAGSSRVFDSMAKQAGCAIAPTLDTLLEICKLFDYQPLPKGRRIGVISNTGGAGVLAADAISDLGLDLANLKSKTKTELKQRLSPIASVNNPVDIVANAGRNEYRISTQLLLKDSNIDALLVICAVPTFAGMTQTEHAAGTLEGVRNTDTGKPIVGVWLAGDIGQPGKDLLEMNQIPCYDDPALAALCMRRTVDYSEWLQSN
ncbi:MAG: acetate--CoA ligase family protein [Candidatus Thorarchaeota archaeon]|jgi:acyl-CoA synthetase (NDP forming)